MKILNCFVVESNFVSLVYVLCVIVCVSVCVNTGIPIDVRVVSNSELKRNMMLLSQVHNYFFLFFSFFCFESSINVVHSISSINSQLLCSFFVKKVSSPQWRRRRRLKLSAISHQFVMSLYWMHNRPYSRDTTLSKQLISKLFFRRTFSFSFTFNCHIDSALLLSTNRPRTHSLLFHSSVFCSCHYILCRCSLSILTKNQIQKMWNIIL